MSQRTAADITRKYVQLRALYDRAIKSGSTPAQASAITTHESKKISIRQAILTLRGDDLAKRINQLGYDRNKDYGLSAPERLLLEQVSEDYCWKEAQGNYERRLGTGFAP